MPAQLHRAGEIVSRAVLLHVGVGAFSLEKRAIPAGETGTHGA